MPETVHYTENSRPFRRELVPELIYDANPALVDFYYLAWKQAWEHIYETESLPFSPYIGEGCKRDRIWIWDSCPIIRDKLARGGHYSADLCASNRHSKEKHIIKI